jgi:hypothetical protein
MKIRNTLFENKQYFETIGKIHSSDKLSVMDAYRINRLVKKLNELNEEYMELKKKLLDQFGTPGEEEGQFIVEGDQREPFAKEMNDLINIEHDLETEMLAFPSKLEDGFSAADLNIMEMFFDLSGFEPEETKKDEPDITTPTEKETE